MSESAVSHNALSGYDARLIQTVQGLEDELRPQGRSVAVTLDSDLERDLGLDSLARVELLLRVERAFDVQLPQDLFTTARTPRDLLQAVSGAGTAVPRAAPASAAVPAAEQTLSEPTVAETLPEVLEWHAGRHPDRVHAVLYGDGGAEGELTYRQLLEAGHGVAYGLVSRGIVPGQAVAIMLPTGAPFLHSFFGILLAGAVPVPIYPPMRRAGLEDHLRRQAAILANAGAAALITVAEAKPFANLLQAQVPALQHVVTPDDLHLSGPYPRRPAVQGADLALLQYTSGSTGNPKGVMLSHANLLANVRAMGRRLEVDKDDVFVSWLPLYHDMGLIGAWLGCLYYAIPLVLMSPLTFLTRPANWLWAVHRYRGTLSGGPNFAYALCLQKVLDEDIEGLDLSRWRFAFNGAEPVSVDTLERFSRRFAAYGFQPEAMTPVYGLAEDSVGLAFPPGRRRPRIDHIEREPFASRGLARPAAPGQGQAFASCGVALPGHQIRIVDDHDRELGERRQGRLQFKGPSATAGYFRNPEATAALFHGDWLDSGDLAYLADGEVYVTGRAKELIIRAGRNIHPYELEEAVGAVAGIRKGCVVAFGVTDPRDGTEDLVIVAETREEDPARREALHRQVNGVLVDIIGNPPDDVRLVPPHTVLKTSSGKLRRTENRALYLSGELGRRRGRWRQWLRLLLPAVRSAVRRGAAGAVRGGYGIYAWLVFTPLALMTWAAVATLPRRSWRMAVIRVMGRLAAALALIRLRVENGERVSASTPCLIVANHASYLDGLVLSFVLPGTPAFVVKRELAGNFFTRVFLQRIGAEFVERFDARRGVEDTKHLRAVAGRGESLVFFPEGTFQRGPGLRPFRMGAFLVAVEAGLPVVPVAIRGTRAVLPADTWLPRRGTISISIGRSILPEGDDWAAAVKARDGARTQILEGGREPDLA